MRHRVPTERLSEILEMTEDGILTVDGRFEIVLFNPAAGRMFGYSESEILGQPLDRLIPESDRPRHRDLMVEFARGAETSRLMGDRKAVRGRRKDGSEFPAEITISRSVAGGDRLFTAVVRDVTVRQQHERTILRLNQELEARVSARTAELAERNVQLALKNEESWRKTEELKATTQQLWQAARLAGVGELAASIAHELNNPLGTVSLRIETVLAQTPADDPRRRALEIIDQEVARMARLVGNLLQFSRPGRDQVSTVDVCEELTKTIELTEHHLTRRGIRTEPEFDPAVPPIFADRQQLRQVFLNLFTNAADAMPTGGRLIPRVRLKAPADAAPAVVIEVADTGVGIPPDHLTRVTEPFFTTKDEGKGTGLGLAICRRIVQQHAGTLEIESRVNHGTTVRITVPVRSDVNVAKLTHAPRP